MQTEPVIAYPNPAKDVINVRFRDGMGADSVEISVYTCSFRLVKKITAGPDITNIYAAGLPDISNGIYYLKAVLLKDSREIFRNVQPVVVLR